MSTSLDAPTPTKVTVDDIPGLDPAPAYTPAAERSAGGVPLITLPTGHRALHVTRYADVQKVLTDTTFARTETNVEDGPSFFPTIMPAELLLNLDAPDHARMRRFVTGDYSAGGVERLRDGLQNLITDRFAALRAQEQPDLFTTVLDPIPLTVNCRSLGIPESDIAYFRPYSRTVQMAPWADVPHLLDHFWKAYNYVTDLVTGARPVVEGGMISRFVRDRDQAEPPLSDKELVGLLFASVLGADQNVLSVMTKVVYSLLCAPSLYRRLVAEPELVPQAVEELIRLVPLGTISTFPRVARHDVELTCGRIVEGDLVYADAFAANRDPEVFADPLRIDVDRQGKRHLQFGYGMHHCMGAALARMQVNAVLTRLVREFPTLELAADPASLPWDHGTLLRRPTSLPVRW
ncbi:cytochrome P450 [Streptomyces flaveolus]|uniref:cytochrome P450 n=1 Tax=Streptomyces flaveolus TaxID=67297 RepID=UPI0033C6F8F3